MLKYNSIVPFLLVVSVLLLSACEHHDEDKEQTRIVENSSDNKEASATTIPAEVSEFEDWVDITQDAWFQKATQQKQIIGNIAQDSQLLSKRRFENGQLRFTLNSRGRCPVYFHVRPRLAEHFDPLQDGGTIALASPDDDFFAYGVSACGSNTDNLEPGQYLTSVAGNSFTVNLNGSRIYSGQLDQYERYKSGHIGVFDTQPDIINLSVKISSSSTEKASDDNHWQDMGTQNLTALWSPKVFGEVYGSDANSIFTFGNDEINVSYANQDFKQAQAYLFYRQPLSEFKLRLEYKFLNNRVTDSPEWAHLNSGVMFFAEDPSSMDINAVIPASVEMQFLAKANTFFRPTGNICSPDTQYIKDGETVTQHCVFSTSNTFDKSEWVTAELHVSKDRKIQHYINGELVTEYQSPQNDDGHELEKGFVAIQAEGQEIRFRNLAIWHP